MTFIRWRLVLDGEADFPHRRKWAQETQRLLPAYLATRRLLESWLFPCEGRDEVIAGICKRLTSSRDGGSTAEWDPKELAYGLWRFTHERYEFGEGRELSQLKEVQLRSTPAVLPHWESPSPIPHVAYRAWLLAAYVTLHALIRKNRGKALDQILQLPQLPASIIPSFVKLAGTSTVTGGVFFPTIDGLPLRPFIGRFDYDAACGRAELEHAS